MDVEGGRRMSQHDENQQPTPLPIEPGHVMSRKKYEEIVEQQQK